MYKYPRRCRLGDSQAPHATKYRKLRTTVRLQENDCNRSDETMSKRPFKTLLGSAVLVAAALSVASAPSVGAEAPKKRAGQYFSFAGKRPSFRQEGTTKSDVAVSS